MAAAAGSGDSVSAEAEFMVRRLQRDINCLSDDSRGTRTKALKKLRDVMLVKAAPAATAGASGKKKKKKSTGKKDKKGKKKKKKKVKDKAPATSIAFLMDVDDGAKSTYVASSAATPPPPPAAAASAAAASASAAAASAGSAAAAAQQNMAPLAVRRKVFMSSLLRPLLKRFADPVELCRELAILLVTDAVRQGVAEPSALLAAVAPIAVERVGTAPFAEEAEEVRLLIVDLLLLLLSPASAAVVSDASLQSGGPLAGAEAAQACLEKIVTAVARAMCDAFADVKRSAASIVMRLTAPELGARGVMHLHLEALLKHSRVRLVSVRAVADVVSCGTEALPKVLDQQLTPVLSKLRHDGSGSVRKATATMLCQWLHAGLPPASPAAAAAAGEKAHEYAALWRQATPQLLALLLSCVGDASVEIASHAFRCLEHFAARAQGHGGDGDVEMSDAPGANGTAEMPTDMAVAAEAAADGGEPAAEAAAATAAVLVDVGDAGLVWDEDFEDHVADFYCEPFSSLPRDVASATSSSSSSSTTTTTTTSTIMTSAEWEAYVAQVIAHPEPEGGRPTAPTRRLVRRHMGTMLPALLKALGAWTVPARVAAAGQLRATLAVAERHATCHLGAVLESLTRVIFDDDEEVRVRAKGCAALVGAFVEPAAVLGVTIPWLRGTKGWDPPAQRRAALAVLTAALEATPADALAPLLLQVARELASPGVRTTEDAGLQSEIVDATMALLGKAAEADQVGAEAGDAAEFEYAVILTLLQMQASAPETVQRSAQLGVRLVARLQAAGGAGGAGAGAGTGAAGQQSPAAQLYARHFRRLLKAATADYNKWRNASPSKLFFEALMRNSVSAAHASAVLGSASASASASGKAKAASKSLPSVYAARVVDVLAANLAPSKDADLRLSLLSLLDTILSGGHDGTDETPATATASTTTSSSSSSSSASAPDAASRAAVASAFRPMTSAIVHRLLLPTLTWRVGRVESTLRKLGTACLVSMLRCLRPTPEDLLSLLPAMQPVLVSCLKDDDSTTRYLTALSFVHLLTLLRTSTGAGAVGGLLDPSLVDTLYPELLARLDDSSDKIRLAICPALEGFYAASRKVAYHSTCIKYSTEVLLVHMDDPVPALRLAVYKVLVAVARIDADAVRKQASAARGSHQSPELCDKLVAVCDGV